MLQSRDMTHLFRLILIGIASVYLAACDQDTNRPSPVPPSNTRINNQHISIDDQIISTKAKFVPNLDLCKSSIIRLSSGVTYLVEIYDQFHPEVLKVNPDGSIVSMKLYAYRITKDSRDNLYFALRGAIGKLTPTGEMSILAGKELGPSQAWIEHDIDAAGTEARFNVIEEIAADAEGNVFVQEGDSAHALIRKINTENKVTTIFNGDVSERKFNRDRESRFAADAKGNIYLGDDDGNIIKIDVKKSDSHKLKDSQGHDIHFDSKILSIAVDAQNNLFVTVGSRSLFKISSAGSVSALHAQPIASDGGGVSKPDLIDGDAQGHWLSMYSGIDVDNEGNIYFADCYNNAIRKLTSSDQVSTLIRSDIRPGNRTTW